MSTGKISTEDFARLSAAMAPAAAFVKSGLACERSVTDAPSGYVRWVHPNAPADQVNFYMGCQESPALEQFFAATRAADEIFQQTTGLH